MGMPDNYHDALRLIERHPRSRKGVLVERNTRVERAIPAFAQAEPDIAVRLHATNVVTFHPDGTLTLSTGGWFTVTTKDRMNRALPRPWAIASKDGRWYLYRMGSEATGWSWTPVCLYFDGLTIGEDGPTNAPDAATAAAVEKAEKDARKGIERYVRRAMVKLSEGVSEDEPGAGCWDCRNPDLEGRTSEDSDPLAHLRQHVAQDEVPIALVRRALEVRGLRPVGIAMYLGWAVDSGEVEVDRYHAPMVARWLREYLLGRLITGRQGGRPAAAYQSLVAPEGL